MVKEKAVTKKVTKKAVAKKVTKKATTKKDKIVAIDFDWTKVGENVQKNAEEISKNIMKNAETIGNNVARNSKAVDQGRRQVARRCKAHSTKAFTEKDLFCE